MKRNLRYDVIIKPIVTEKSLKQVEELNQYAFEVSRRVSKEEVKRAVEEKFKVKVEKVRMLNLRGKRIQWGRQRIQGKRKDRKKAVVTLKSSDSIDLFKVK